MPLQALEMQPGNVNRAEYSVLTRMDTPSAAVVRPAAEVYAVSPIGLPRSPRLEALLVNGSIDATHYNRVKVLMAEDARRSRPDRQDQLGQEPSSSLVASAAEPSLLDVSPGTPKREQSIVFQPLPTKAIRRSGNFAGPIPPHVDNMKASQTPAEFEQDQIIRENRRRDAYAKEVESGRLTVEAMARGLKEDIADSQLTLIVRRYVRDHGSVTVNNTTDKPLPRGLVGVEVTESSPHDGLPKRSDIVRFEVLPETSVDPQEAIRRILRLVNDGGSSVGDVPSAWNGVLPSRIDTASVALKPTPNGGSVVALEKAAA